jgi:predicted DNA-binding transcriptional regulator YafY
MAELSPSEMAAATEPLFAIYLCAKDGRRETHVVSGCRLHDGEHGAYLACWDASRADVRRFSVDRFVSVRRLSEVLAGAPGRRSANL